MSDPYFEIQRKRQLNDLQQQLASLPDDFSLESSTQPQAKPQASPGIASDIAQGAARGVNQGFRNLFNAIDDAGNWLNDNIVNLRTHSQQKAYDELKGEKVGDKLLQSGVDYWNTGTTTNQVSSDISEFLLGFIPALRGAKAMGVASGAANVATKVAPKAAGAIGTIAEGAVAGAGAAATTVTPETANLSNFINEHAPALSNPITEYLAIDPNDSTAEKRLKQALDNALSGVVVDSVVMGLMKGIKAFKSKKITEGATPEQVAQEFQEASKPTLADDLDKQFGIGQEPKSAMGSANVFESHRGNLPASKELKVTDELPVANTVDSEAEANKILKGSKLRVAENPQMPGIDFVPEPKPLPKTALELGNWETSKPFEFSALSAEEKAALKSGSMRLSDDLQMPVIDFVPSTNAPIRTDLQLADDLLKNRPLTYVPKVSVSDAGIVIGKTAKEGAVPLEVLNGRILARGEELLKKPGFALTPEERIALKGYRDLQESLLHQVQVEVPFSAGSGKAALSGFERVGGEVVEGSKKVFSDSERETLRKEGQELIEGIRKNQEALEKALQDSAKIHSIEKSGQNTKDLMKEGILNADGTFNFSTFKSQAGFFDPEMFARILVGSSRGEMASSALGFIGGWNTQDADASLKDKLMMGAMGSIAGRTLFKLRGGKEIEEIRKREPVTTTLVARPGLEGIAPKEFKRLPTKRVSIDKDRLAIFGEKVKAGEYAKITPEDTAELGALIRNIDTEEDLEQLLTMTAQVFEKDAKAASVGAVGNKATGVRTWEEARQLSEGLMGAKTIDALFTKTKYLDAQMYAARATLTASASDVKAAAKNLTDLVNGTSSQKFVSANEAQAAIDAAALAFSKAQKTHAALYAKVKGSSSEVARSLNAHRMVVKSEEMLKGELSALVESMGGRQHLVGIANALKGIDDPAAITAALNTSLLSRITDAALYTRLTGILWSPITQTRNILGNTLRTISTPMEGLFEAGIAGLRSGEDDVARMSLGEVKSQVFGLWQGMKDAVQFLYQEKKFGEQFYKNIAGDNAFVVHEGMTKVGDAQMFKGNPWGNLVQNPTSQAGQYLQKGLDMFGSVQGANLHFMGATDKFFQALNYRMSMNAQAYRAALGEGIEPGTKEFSERMAQFLDSPTIDMSEQAMGAAKESTFQQSLDQGGWLDKVGSLINSGRSQVPLFNLLVPFVKTPTNILRYVGDRVPGLAVVPGLARQAAANQAILKEGGPAADKLLAQWAFGSTMLMAASMLAYEGYLVGGADGVRDKSGNLQNSQDYAIKIGNQTYKIDGLDPIGMFFGMAADVVAALKRNDEKGAGEVVMAGLTAAGKYMLSRSYMEGIFEGVSVMNDIQKLNAEQGQKKFGDYLAKMSTGFLPFGGASQWAAKQFDPTVKSYWDWKDRWKAKIPFASQSVYAKRNVLTGEPIVNEGALGPDLISPLTSRTLDDSPSVKELVRLGINVDYPDKNLDHKIGLSPDQYDRLQVLATQEVKLRGKTMKEALDDMVASPRWDRYPDGQDGYTNLSNTKQQMMRGIINTYRDRAEKMLIREDEGLAGLFKQSRQNKANARKGLPIEPIQKN